MTLNQTFENWEIQSDRVDDKLYFVNTETGDEVELQKDGTVKSPAVTADNLGLGDVTGDGIPAQALEHGKIWADDGQVYSDMSDAESAASNLLLIGPGTFGSDSDFGNNDALRVSTADLTVVGAGKSTVLDGGTSGNGFTALANGVSVRDVAVKTASGQGNSINGAAISGTTSNVTLMNIFVLGADNIGIRVGGDGNRVVVADCASSSIDNEDIKVQGDNNVVDDITGTVNDAGTGNAVGETA